MKKKTKMKGWTGATSSSPVQVSALTHCVMGNIGDNVHFKCGGREFKILNIGKFEIFVCLGVDDACAYRFRSINKCFRLHIR